MRETQAALQAVEHQARRGKRHRLVSPDCRTAAVSAAAASKPRMRCGSRASPTGSFCWTSITSSTSTMNTAMTWAMRCCAPSARFSRRQLRNSSDMAARLGGDEFAVLCFGDINEQTLHDVAERIRSQIGKEPLATPEGAAAFHGQLRSRVEPAGRSGLEDACTAEPTPPCTKPRRPARIGFPLAARFPKARPRGCGPSAAAAPPTA